MNAHQGTRRTLHRQVALICRQAAVAGSCCVGLWMLWLCVLLPGNAFSQGSHYLRQTLGTRDGLLSPKIYSLFQSNDRQLYIGTELGLSIYNGYEFRNFQYASDKESIGRIQAITQDSTQTIWIGGNKGLFRLYRDSFIRVDISGRTNVAVESLQTDREGNLWIGELTFLYKVNAKDLKGLRGATVAKLNVAPFAGLKERAFDLDVDTDGNVYMASHGGVYLFPKGQHNYKLIWENPDPNNFVSSVAALSPDTVSWNRVDGHPTEMIHGIITNYYSLHFLGWKVFRYKKSLYALTTNDIAEINNGINPVVSFFSLVNHAQTAMMDAEGNIWVGTWEGLLKYRKSPFTVYQLSETPHPEVFSMMERKDGSLLFGGNRGKLFTRKKDSIVPASEYPSLFKTAEVLCLRETSDGALWAGSGYQGISRLQNHQLKSWSNTGRLPDNNCEALIDDGRGRFFACTERGVTLIDPLLADPLIDHFDFADSFSRPPELYGSFAVGENNRWFYGNQGLFILKDRRLVADSILNMPVLNLYINKIVEDKAGIIWVATQGMGLLQCKMENGKLRLKRAYDTGNGFLSNVALSVLVDKNNNIWCADYMSLSMIDQHDGRIIHFNENDGLLSTYYQTLKLEQEKSGTIWGLSTRGIFSFHPDSVYSNELPPTILLEGRQSANRADREEYSYRQPFIRLTYFAVSLSDPSKIRYAYRLLEKDSTWVYTSSRMIEWSALSPGNYTLELMGSNNSNVWSKPVQYKFRVRPPFWQSIWFRLLVVVLVSALVYLLVKRRITIIREKAAIRQQMAELEGKALRAQMNPHFIFNSLNAIQKLIVVQDMESSYGYLSKFSKLLRLVLDNSDKNQISLSQELEMNRLYLELESLRFKNSFEYNIDLSRLTDADSVLISSLLLQPFIENAIWHGLMHKEGEKKLLISFQEHEQYLLCNIVDNGVGRTHAAAIKSQKLGAQYFESKGTRLSEQRIRILTDRSAGAILNFTDLVDEQGRATGTSVTIKIPLQKSKVS